MLKRKGTKDRGNILAGEEIIRSAENLRFKACSRLLQKKYRDREGLFLVEGQVLLADALHSGGVLRALLLSEDEPAESAEALYRGGLSAETPLVRFSAPLYRRLSSTEHGRGIMAVAEKQKEELLPENWREGNILVLDRLQDPGNIGTILRTADAAGIAAVITLKGTGDIYAPKVVRAAAGSLFRMRNFALDSAADFLSFAEENGFSVVVTLPEDKGSLPWRSLRGRRKIALVIGNEGSGIAEELLQAADQAVHIPMSGKIESLNAAVAAGILLYALRE